MPRCARGRAGWSETWSSLAAGRQLDGAAQVVVRDAAPALDLRLDDLRGDCSASRDEVALRVGGELGPLLLEGRPRPAGAGRRAARPRPPRARGRPRRLSASRELQALAAGLVADRVALGLGGLDLVAEPSELSAWAWTSSSKECRSSGRMSAITSPPSPCRRGPR